MATKIDFGYDPSSPDAEYYELLINLMENWENETVEFKEAKGQYSEDKIGQYFSAISNEANLRNQQYGWLILGVSEQKQKYPVGTSFKDGEQILLEKLKYTISRDTTDGITFLDIITLRPIYKGVPYRVLMFKIPAAVAGIPTEWKTRYYARNGENLVPMQQYKIDAIRSQQRKDWTRQILNGATIADLDKDALVVAREKYIEKMNRLHITEEVDGLSNEEFLNKLKLMVGNKVTNAAMLLLGNPERDNLFDVAPSMMWRLIAADGTIKDYEIFNIPFLTVGEKLFSRVRNLTYRYMANPRSLFPLEIDQYDTWLLRELLNNCIAHSNYLLGGRIYVNEEEDSISISNPGDFLPQNIETVLKSAYNPPFYRNQLLADAMVKLNMIDTATSGIKKIYRIQKERYFPLPDYDLSRSDQVTVKIYGTILDNKYTYTLFEHPDLAMEEVFVLDQRQKAISRNTPEEAIELLRKQNTIRAGANLSTDATSEFDEKTIDANEKTYSDNDYLDMIVEYLKKYGKAQKKDIRNMIWDKLPIGLDNNKKNIKISTLLTSLRVNGVIATDSPNQQLSYWILVDNKD